MISVTKTRKQRTTLTTAQESAIREAWQGGLKSINKENMERIQILAENLHLDKSVVRNKINNLNAKSAGRTQNKVPGRMNGYTLFLKKEKASPGTMAFKEAVKVWKDMTQADKVAFNNEAKEEEEAKTSSYNESQRKKVFRNAMKIIRKQCDLIQQIGGEIGGFSIFGNNFTSFGTSNGTLGIEPLKDAFSLNIIKGEHPAPNSSDSGTDRKTIVGEVRQALKGMVDGGRGFPFKAIRRGTVKVLNWPEGVPVGQNLNDLGIASIKRILEAVPQMKLLRVGTENSDAAEADPMVVDVVDAQPTVEASVPVAEPTAVEAELTVQEEVTEPNDDLGLFSKRMLKGAKEKKNKRVKLDVRNILGQTVKILYGVEFKGKKKNKWFRGQVLHQNGLRCVVQWDDGTTNEETYDEKRWKVLSSQGK